MKVDMKENTKIDNSFLGMSLGRVKYGPPPLFSTGFNIVQPMKVIGLNSYTIALFLIIFLAS